MRYFTYLINVENGINKEWGGQSFYLITVELGNKELFGRPKIVP